MEQHTDGVQGFDGVGEKQLQSLADFGQSDTSLQMARVQRGDGRFSNADIDTT